LHLDWDERGIQFPAAETLPPRTETVSTTGVTIYRVPWSAVEAVEPVDPWPAVRVSWPGASEVLCPELEEAAEFAVRVEALVAETRRRAPGASSPGWLSAPELDWERVKYMPGELPSRPGEGAYRSLDAPGDETVVAARLSLTVVEAFFDWLASTSAFPFREQPLEVIVTEDDVYARFRDETVRRLPRAQLRTRIEVRRAGTIYVFGRAARLLVPAGPSNTNVAAELDAQLQRAPGAPP